MGLILVRTDHLKLILFIYLIKYANSFVQPLAYVRGKFSNPSSCLLLSLLVIEKCKFVVNLLDMVLNINASVFIN